MVSKMFLGLNLLVSSELFVWTFHVLLVLVWVFSALQLVFQSKDVNVMLACDSRFSTIY